MIASMTAPHEVIAVEMARGGRRHDVLYEVRLKHGDKKVNVLQTGCCPGSAPEVCLLASCNLWPLACREATKAGTHPPSTWRISQSEIEARDLLPSVAGAA